MSFVGGGPLFQVAMRVQVAVTLLVLCLALAASPATAWSPQTSVEIALQGATISPPDFKRMIERHEAAFKDGVLEPARHPTNTGEPLDRVIEIEVERAISMIISHQSMEQVVRQSGVVAYYVAYANNPLVIGRSDPDEGTYFADYLGYVDSARPRFAAVFYGLVPEFEDSGRVADLMRRTYRRGQILYPLVGSEYERVGGPPGRDKFDDRSTAFGISAVAFSHALTDVAIVLRHIWLEGGGGDPRAPLLVRTGEFQAPRTSAVPLEDVQHATDRF